MTASAYLRITALLAAINKFNKCTDSDKNYYYYHNHHHHLLWQGIYTYIPETNYVPREYSVAAILLSLFTVLISLVPVLNLLYFYISTFRSMCAVSNMAVFHSSLPDFMFSWFIIIIIIIIAL